MGLNQVMRAAVRKGKRRPGRPPRWMHPDPAIRYYEASLLAYVADIYSIARIVVVPRVPDIIQERRHVHTLDDWGDEFQGLMFGFGERVDNLGYNFDSITRKTAVDTSEFNRKQWTRQVKAAFGVDFISSEPWLRPQITAFAARNADLISSLKDDAVKRVNQWTIQGIQNGDRVEAIQAKLEESLGVSRSKAELIARDQVGKLNGQLSQARQTGLGVKSYIWQTAEDDRVRPEHEERDGEQFDWANPPADGHPGEPVQCRCVALPVMDDLLDLEGADNEAE